MPYAATRDTLTGLPNRSLFNQGSRTRSRTCGATANPSRCCFLDPDDFKEVNDTRGHPFGNLVLAEFAQHLCRCLRDSDTVARFGGDEFVAWVERLGDPQDAAGVSNKVIEMVHTPFHVDGVHWALTASIGISLYPLDRRDLPALLNTADDATYRAKARGRNRYVFRAE